MVLRISDLICSSTLNSLLSVALLACALRASLSASQLGEVSEGL
jgi:hypothetical protein